MLRHAACTLIFTPHHTETGKISAVEPKTPLEMARRPRVRRPNGNRGLCSCLREGVLGGDTPTHPSALHHTRSIETLLTSGHTCAAHAHPLRPRELASVPSGTVLVRLRVLLLSRMRCIYVYRLLPVGSGDFVLVHEGAMFTTKKWGAKNEAGAT